MMENPSFATRRPAASTLPNFQLPPPDLGNLHKFPAFAPANAPTQPTPQTVNNVLTPPPALNEGLSPLSSSVNSGSSQSSSTGVPPYNPMGFWPPQNPAYAYSSAPPMPAPFAQNPGYMNRQLYSPSMNYPQQRNSNSPTTGEGLPAPPYELNLPPFPTSLPMNGSSGGGPAGPVPNRAPQQHPQQLHPQQQHPQQQHQQHQQHQQQQQQQQQQQHQQQQQQHQQQQQQQQHQQQQQQQQHHQQHQQQHQMANAMMNSQQSTSQAPQQAPIHAPENFGPRPPPTPTYYAPSSTPQQASFPAYAQPSPTQQSPITSGPSQNRISPVSANHPPSMQPPPGHYQRPPYNGYPLPAMSGPIMSNVHSPGGQMTLVGGAMNMPGYPPHMGQHMYSGHPGQQQQQNDRPFKCDQCPQSFNRNHDLKRHKRIHLAVKPFPCGHCEKSFSRKDALKRHILVKGCGKSGQPTAPLPNGGSQSPLDKSEMMSDSTDDGPELMKKEI